MSEKPVVENIQDALIAFGVTDTTLTDAEKQSLDKEGYILFERLIDEDWLGKLRVAYEALMKKEGQSAGLEVHQEQGTRRLSDLVNKGQVFDGIYTHPKVLAAVYHVLGRDFKLSSLNGRDAIPGQGRQGLHADWGRRKENEPFHVVNSLWMLDDFTPDNGATRVVPGTHLLNGGPSDYMDNSEESHPDQVLALAPAGSIVIFNSHLWHGGTQNCSSNTRRALHSYYTAREHGQQLNQREYVRKSTYDRISLAARYILDV